jgi:hypothetical protein
MASTRPAWLAKGFGKLYFLEWQYCELANGAALQFDKSDTMKTESKTASKRRLYLEALQRYEKQLLSKTKKPK